MAISSLPNYIMHYFWGDNLKELSISKNKEYIVQTIFEQGNQKAVKWLFDTFDKAELKGILSKIRLSNKSAHFWSLYLS